MNPTIQRIIAEAQKLIKQRDRKGARKILQQAVQHYPREAHLWYWLGQTLDERKQASYAFERALMYDPSLHQAQKFLDRINASIRSSAPSRQPPPPSRPASPELPAKKAPSPAPAVPAPQKQEKEAESDLNLDWLMNRTAPSPTMPKRQKPEGQAPQPPSPQPKEEIRGEPSAKFVEKQEDEGTSWSFLEELSEDDLYVEPSEKIPDEASQSALSDSSLLEELQENNQGSLEGEKATTSEDPWDFLTNELLSSNIEGIDQAIAPPENAVPNAFGISEDELWQRAEAFIGDVRLPESLLPENQAGQKAKIERGAFSFSDAPPSLAAQLPVRSGLAPLTEKQIKAALGVESGKGSETEQKQSQKQSPARRGRLLGCLVLFLLLLVLLASAGWYLLKGSFYPTSLEEVKEVNPELISTQVAELQVRYLTTAATPLPAPDWVAEAQELRYQNNFTAAEERLRAGLEAEAGNSIGLATLSDLLRERPGREAEALTLAEEASAAATTAEERAYASQSYLWALAYQAQVDVGKALASAEQAVEETPESPHAFWALAMARAFEGNVDGSREALLSATALSEEVQLGALAAQEAEVYARIGELEQAVARYEEALKGTDYVPWRVELVKLERQLEHPDLPFHLDYLRQIAPDDPAVQQLGQ